MRVCAYACVCVCARVCVRESNAPHSAGRTFQRLKKTALTSSSVTFRTVSCVSAYGEEQETASDYSVRVCVVSSLAKLEYTF